MLRPLWLFAVALALLPGACASSNLGDPSVDAPPQAADAAALDAAAQDAAANSDSQQAGADAGPNDPDAAPCTPIWNNLLGNAGFEAGRTIWSENLGGSTNPIIRQQGGGLPFSANDGTWAALMLGYNGADVRLGQAVTVPADATALRFVGYKCWVTTETDLATRDRLTVSLHASGGALLETLATLNDGDAEAVCSWAFFSYPAASTHAGQTVELVLDGLADASQPTSFAFDSVSLEALSCP